MFFDNLFTLKLKNKLKISINNEELYSLFLLSIFNKTKQNLLIVTSNLNECNKLYNNLAFYNQDVYLFPEDDYLSKRALVTSPEFFLDRITFLNSINNSKNKIVITNINGFLKKLPNVNKFKEMAININVNKEIDRNLLLKKLEKIGYKRETLVTQMGEYAIRGMVIDIYPFDFKNPIRLEMFGEAIEKISEFDINTQRSLKEELKNVNIKPIIDDDLEQKNSYLLDYLDDALVIYQDYNEILTMQKNINEQKKFYNDNEYIDVTKLNIKNCIYVDKINNNDSEIVYDAQDITAEVTSFEKLEKFLIKENSKSYVFLNNIKLPNDLKIKPENIVNSSLNKSFKFNGICYISLLDVVGNNESKEYKSKIKYGTKISDLNDLNIGDYVVHKDHGIGIYNGIKTIEKNGVKKDYILINYKSNDKLYIPAQNLKKIYKYSSKDGKIPKIYRLNSKDWVKTKYKIKNKIKDISQNLIKLYKERNNIIVKPYEADTPLQAIFESEFPYIETKDQLKASYEIKKDMEKNKPMERLLCGDVGYGKTEVIFRAIFKTIMNDKQVCYLCPTTLLAQQQYKSALNRFKNHAVTIEIFTRHTTTKEKNRILNELNEGKIDIVFGTHRLLSDDITYRDLGLLVIDEEHRFGVEHKEKIKEKFKKVNVLSVSATPIPRSLQMSLVGIRDMSLIETPPQNRYPVQTYVINYDELVLKEAINKEILRDGQVFIIYNNISKLPNFQKKLQSMFKNLNIAYAHGQMNKEEINNIMEKFVNKKTNILITTTIIENGIDIPNANTIIVIDADRFGLSQLYQIRGRVGRSNKIAYAYLFYDNSKILNDNAKKRLEAIKEFTTLGSGYKISMRDLSIRGAGDLLGKEQAGYIDSVGVDMYLELVNEELENIRENVKEEKEENEIILDEVETHVSEDYTDKDELIIELHELINSIDTEEKYNDVFNEIKDRYGFVDKKIEYYMQQELLEGYLNKNDIKVITNNKFKMSLELNEKIYKNLNVEELFIEALRISTKINFKYQNNNIVISLNKLGIENEYVILLNKLLKYIDSKL